jgi:uncharacterized membrane protein (DUF4010 family)
MEGLDPLILTLRFAAALGLGVLLGLERERTKTQAGFAGVRTLGLLALAGGIAAFIDESLARPWLALGVFAAAAGLVLVSYRVSAERGELGITTEVSALLAFLLGFLCLRGYTMLAAGLAVASGGVLALKDWLHRLSSRIEAADVEATLKFAIVSIIILPLVPDRSFGPPPLDVINPFKIWLMVVLISGLSLAGYLALRLLGTSRSLPLLGTLGGLASSTATTMVYARQGGSRSATVPVGGMIVSTANLAALVRLGVVSAAVAPAALPVVLPVLASGLLLGVVPLARRMRGVLEKPDLGVPELDNPTNLRVALGFGALYAVILFGAAWLAERAGSHGLYVIAIPGGFADVDAITLSSLALFNSGTVSAPVAARAVAIAFTANAAFKLALLYFLGGREMLKSCAPMFAAAVIGLAIGIALFA